MSTTEYVWSVLRDDLVARWADSPHAPLEQRILDVWERHPQLVLDAAEHVAERYERGAIRSPWAVLAKHVEDAAANADRADRPAMRRDKAKQRARAEQWLRATGVHFDLEREVEDELFGDRGMLRAYADDDGLREAMLALWQHERPRALRSELEAAGRMRLNAEHYLRQRELERARRMGLPAPVAAPATADDNPFL
jgi:hypothetical protein